MDDKPVLPDSENPYETTYVPLADKTVLESPSIVEEEAPKDGDD